MISSRTPGRWAAALGITLLVMLAGVQGVAAFHTGHYTTMTKSIDVPARHVGGGRLACPRGQLVASGGAFLYFPNQRIESVDAYYLHLGASVPIKGNKAWYASGFDAHDTTGAKLRIVIHCLPASTIGSVAVNATSFTAASPGPAGGYVSCPVGQRIITGGAIWQVPGDPPSPSLALDYLLTSTSPTLQADGWYGAGFHAQGAGTSARLRVVAVCGTRAKVGEYALRTATYAAFWNGGAVGGHLSCPSGKQVVGGGAYWQVPGSPVGPDPALSQDLVLGAAAPTTNRKGVYASGANFTSVHYLQLVLTVLCRPI